MKNQRELVNNATVVSIADKLRSGNDSIVQTTMWVDPKDLIETAIRSAFVSYLKDDDPDGRMYWIAPKQCSSLAMAVVLELQTKGFQIVKQAT